MFKNYITILLLLLPQGFCFAAEASKNQGAFLSPLSAEFNSHKDHWKKLNQSEEWQNRWFSPQKQEKWLRHLVKSYKENPTFRKNFSQSPLLWLQVNEYTLLLARYHNKLEDPRENLSYFLAATKDLAILYIQSWVHIKFCSPLEAPPAEWASEYPPSPGRLKAIYTSRPQLKDWDKSSLDSYNEKFTQFDHIIDPFFEEDEEEKPVPKVSELPQAAPADDDAERENLGEESNRDDSAAPKKKSPTKQNLRKKRASKAKGRKPLSPTKKPFSLDPKDGTAKRMRRNSEKEGGGSK